MELRLTSAAFIVILATYVFVGMMGVSDRENPNARDASYNLLSRGLLSGHLYLDAAAPPGLSKLRDPYDPKENKPFTENGQNHLHDMSYFHGRLYMYYGIAPALLVFIPWHLATGGWLPHWAAVVLLCSAGLLLNVSLLHSIKRRIFPASPPWLLGMGTLVLGLGSYAPILLERADLWEIPIAFCYLSVSMALLCLWKALCRPHGGAGWIALAGAALGAAFAARPNVVPAFAILAIPFVLGAIRRNPRNYVAAVLPLGLIGAGVAFYNAQRFGNPFDFGVQYMLASDYVAKLKLFNVDYLPTNLHLYLFQRVRWDAVFPFAHEPADAVLPAGHAGIEHISGILLNAPILLAGLAVPAFMCVRRPDRAFGLLSLAASWVALSSLVFIANFAFACARYEYEFTPALALLAALGLMALENAPGARIRHAARFLWIPALVFSSAFPILYGIDGCVMNHNYNGIRYAGKGDILGAECEFDTARLLSPGDPFSRLESGALLSAQGRSTEALAVFEALVRDHPDYIMGQFDLGHELARNGRMDEAIEHLQIAQRLAPADEKIRSALGNALAARSSSAHP